MQLALLYTAGEPDKQLAKDEKHVSRRNSSAHNRSNPKDGRQAQ